MERSGRKSLEWTRAVAWTVAGVLATFITPACSDADEPSGDGTEDAVEDPELTAGNSGGTDGDTPGTTGVAGTTSEPDPPSDSSGSVDTTSTGPMGSTGSDTETDGGEPTVPDPVEPVRAVYQGVRQHTSFSNTVADQDFWTYEDIAYTAPQGRVTNEQANQWIAWYVRADELYRVVSGRPDFDFVYRANTEWGPKKIVAVVEGQTCGAGCGNKQKAETDQGFLDQMLDDPADYQFHWIFFYEMGRGGSPEPWYGRATWPSNTVILPHLMAGLSYYEVGGGEDGLRDTFIPGDLLAELETWEEMDIEYVDHFVASDQQKVGSFTSHHLMPAMLWKIRMETDLETIGEITANMATKPPATSGQQAMCDFRDAVNDATDGAFDEQMIGPWGLPHDC